MSDRCVHIFIKSSPFLRKKKKRKKIRNNHETKQTGNPIVEKKCTPITHTSSRCVFMTERKKNTL